ncbi:AAA family ATPase [Niallia taxi]|uniref:AAA family ATPase n=1 Tax=Niallia taxi TaxID=2499688 RepID=UPI0015F58FC7|nr:AAA family ATPase [Niallia taxi]
MFLKKITLLKDDIPQVNSYPFSIPAIKGLRELELTNKMTFFIGENGSGKSTLLEAVADKCGFHTAGGGKNNYYDVHSSHSDLGEYIRLSWMPKITNGFFLRAESFYHFATLQDELEKDPFTRTNYRAYGGKSLLQQSHGESFLSLFQHRFNGQAIYLLDEPEAALSPQRQLTFIRILHDLVEYEDCQFIIATHSPILLGYPNASILNFDGGTITEIQYEQTDNYRLTKYFLQHREKMLNELLRDD